MKKRNVFRPYIPEIVDADTAAYLLCISRSTYDNYVDLGFLPEADVVFGNLKRWRWSTIVDHITRHPSVALIGADVGQVDPYLKAIWDGAKATR
ncbi:hypothetical protein [Hyphomicrobium facile]|uniref:Uncharacterized protein n=1 Tax=Hyphomicrobium facile TaxID=51670 RepID=A0A1I7NDZ1_9HYPH|nr:hypothetical protein [Hyphomicrobium facile]SFV32897.1 hypothetical protein SAMN04488557_1765 [Hyphomicrobium facile]